MASFIYPSLQQAVDLLTPSITDATNLIPHLPDGFKFILAPGNVIVAVHPEYPTHYLDESTMQWRVLEVHISEVAKCAS